MLRDKLQNELGLTDWKALAAHYKRDAVVLVAPELDLVEVGVQVAENNVAQITTWINEGLLTKPTAEYAKIWESREILCLIIQPYVLVQEKSLSQ